MKLGILNKETVSQTPQKRGRVVVAANIVRTKVMLDIDGNEIDMRTKQIIKKNTK